MNFPMRPELFFLSPFVYKELKIDSFCDVKCNFELIFFIKKGPNVKKNYTKSEQSMPTILRSHTNYNPR